jgi:glycosyltransferase involved in cell wall biosynthesis
MTLPIASPGLLHAAPLPAQAVGAPLNIAIVTRLRDRKAHLLESLPTWLRLPVAEIVIVDWSSRDGNLADLVRYLDDPRVKVVRVEGRPTFERSAAWNLGILHASAEWVFLLDADVKVVGSPLADQVFTVPNYEQYFRLYSDKYLPHLFGCGIVLKDHWRAVGGFNEHLVGWSWEDVDFYRRLQRYGLREVTLSSSHYEPLPHDEEGRVAAHDEKDLAVSVARNAYRSRMIESIALHVAEGALVHCGGAAVRTAHYEQSVTYRADRAAIERMLASAEFRRLAKRYAVYESPTSVERLFEVYEFRQLERRFLRPAGRQRSRRRPTNKGVAHACQTRF